MVDYAVKVCYGSSANEILGEPPKMKDSREPYRPKTRSVNKLTPQQKMETVEVIRELNGVIWEANNEWKKWTEYSRLAKAVSQITMIRYGFGITPANIIPSLNYYKWFYTYAKRDIPITQVIKEDSGRIAELEKEITKLRETITNLNSENYDMSGELADAINVIADCEELLEKYRKNKYGEDQVADQA